MDLEDIKWALECDENLFLCAGAIRLVCELGPSRPRNRVRILHLNSGNKQWISEDTVDIVVGRMDERRIPFLMKRHTMVNPVSIFTPVPVRAVDGTLIQPDEEIVIPMGRVVIYLGKSMRDPLAWLCKDPNGTILRVMKDSILAPA